MIYIKEENALDYIVNIRREIEQRAECYFTIICCIFNPNIL